jgi:hypothetical protein
LADFAFQLSLSPGEKAALDAAASQYSQQKLAGPSATTTVNYFTFIDGLGTQAASAFLSQTTSARQAAIVLMLTNPLKARAALKAVGPSN